MPPPNDAGWASHAGRKTFDQVLADAIRELSSTGYTSPEQINRWTDELRRAAEFELGPNWHADPQTRAKLDAIFTKLIERGGIETYVPGVSRFTLNMVRPHLRAELDRRIVAAADLIKLHREEAVERALARFRGWSTSIPVGGDETIDKRETKASIGKSLTQLNFERRRCETDQGMKLIANIAEIVATDNGAIAGIWHDHGEHDRSYNARKEHMARAGKIFVVRDNWAMREGIMKLDGHQYMDEVTRPAQEVSCRCFYQWITSPRRLPDSMLTRKGQEWVAAGRMAA